MLSSENKKIILTGSSKNLAEKGGLVNAEPLQLQQYVHFTNCNTYVGTNHWHVLDAFLSAAVVSPEVGKDDNEKGSGDATANGHQDILHILCVLNTYIYCQLHVYFHFNLICLLISFQIYLMKNFNQSSIRNDMLAS